MHPYSTGKVGDMIFKRSKADFKIDIPPLPGTRSHTDYSSKQLQFKTDQITYQNGDCGTLLDFPQLSVVNIVPHIGVRPMAIIYR